MAEQNRVFAKVLHFLSTLPSRDGRLAGRVPDQVAEHVVDPVGMFRVAIQCVFAPTENVQSSRGLTH